jgi:histidine ammonia-lyase
MTTLDGRHLTLTTLVNIARKHENVRLSKEAMEAVDRAADVVSAIARGDTPVYGINTGFGHLASVTIDKCDVRTLQENLLKSHACGTGKPLDKDVVRAMIALRANALAVGYSGIRGQTLMRLLSFLDHDIVPVVYDTGSLGASGDLVPLAHMALPLIGLGEVFYKGVRMPAAEALACAGLDPVYHLHAKEGLALINGTQAMGAIASLALYDSYRLYRLSNLAYGLSMEALEGITDALDPRVHDLRGHHGQRQAASDMRRILEGSGHTGRPCKGRVQDAYSLRCAPQVHGASLSAFDHVKGILETEMNAVTDNPLVFPEDSTAISAGNFHGQPLALALDYMAMATSELASISERRIERLVNPALSNGLPPFLSSHPGLNSGFMIVQYAAASIVSRNKVLSHPASVDSIPSSANQEDHVSMGFNAALKAREIVDNSLSVIIMELMTAAQAVDLRGPDGLSPVTKALHARIRTLIPFVKTDVLMHDMIDALGQGVKDGIFDDLMEDLTS